MSDVEVGTKRSNEEDEYGEISSPKRSRNQKEEIRLLVSGKCCGAIIGKSGENIKRLRKDNSVHIKLQDTHSVGTITLGGERESCVSVVKDLLPLITAEAPYPVNQKQKCTCEINLLIQNDRVGSVIGKGGSKIREIENESGGKVRVYGDCLPNSNERIVAIGGEDEARILVTVDVILKALEDHPLKKQMIYYDPRKDGAQSGERENQRDSHNQLGGLGGLGLGGLTGLGGLGGLGGIAGGLLGQLGLGGLGNAGLGGIGAGNASSDFTGGDGGGIDGGYRNENRERGRGPRGEHRNGEFDEQRDRPAFEDMETEMKITVLNDMCGAIIGKRGDRIREIRQASGAKVDFSHNENGSKAPRVITVVGTQKQIMIAQQLMSEFVRNRTT